MPSSPASSGGDRASVCEVGAHLRQAKPEPGESGCCVRPQPIEGAAVSLAPETRFGDDVLFAEQHAAGQPAESLVERHVDGVEQRGDVGQRPIVERRRLPQSGAVEVDCGAPRMGTGDLGDEVVPGREPAADLALRELDQERGERLADRFDVGHGQQLPPVADRPPDQAVEPLIGLVLVQLEVAGRMERDDLPAAPVSVHPQRDLLGHRAARHEHALPACRADRGPPPRGSPRCRPRRIRRQRGLRAEGSPARPAPSEALRRP